MRITRKMPALLCLVLLTGALLYGHPASDIRIDYNQKSHQLDIVVNHTSSSTESHFIDKIIVKLNDREIINQTFQSQETGRAQSVVYRVIDAKVEDKFEVITECSKGGTRTEKYTIPKNEDIQFDE